MIKKIITLLITVLILLLLTLKSHCQTAVILSKQEGANKYTHGNISGIVSEIHSLLVARGICNIIIAYGNYNTIDTSDICFVFNVSSSGSEFMDSTDYIWWQSLPERTGIMNIHAGAGDCNRHTSVGAPATLDAWAETWGLFSLPNNNKHGSSNNTDDVYITFWGNLFTPSLPDTLFNVKDEVYHVHPTQWPSNNSFWITGPTPFYVMAEIDEDGPFSNGTKIPVMTAHWTVPYLHHVINLTLGHDSDIHTPGKPQHMMMEAGIDYLISERYLQTGDSCQCRTLNIKYEDLLQDTVNVEDRIYDWYDLTGRYLGKSKHAPIKGVILIRKWYSEFDKIYIID